MKPGFALLFSQDSIGLMQRTAEGWESLGEAVLAAPDFGAQLAALRGAAADRAGEAITSKLVIPGSEILYITVTAPGPTAASRRAQVRAALEGRTPYAVKELAFDWRGAGPEVQVAVVARETLAEAEGFAEEHGFGPMSFVASPEPSQFAGEPFFGAASGADTRLRPGEKVERDPDPVLRGGIDAQPAAAPETPRLEPASGNADASFPATPEDASVTPDVSALSAALALASASAPVPPSATPAASPEPGAAPASSVPDLPSLAAVDLAPEPDLTPEPAVATAPDAPPDQSDLPAAPLPDMPADQPADLNDRPALAASASLPPPENLMPPPLARSTGIDVLSPALDMPPDLLPDVASATGGGSAPAIARLKAKLAEGTGDGRGNSARRPNPGTPPPGPAGGPGARVPKPAARAEGTGPRLAVVAQDGRVTRPAPVTRPAIKGSARSNVSMVTAPGIPLPRDRRVNIPSADAEAEGRARSDTDTRNPARPAPVKKSTFGAQNAARRGKPRYLGWILTGALLLLLAAVAAWSSFYLASNDGPEKVTVAAGPAPVAVPDPAATALPAIGDERAADLQDRTVVQPDAAVDATAVVSVADVAAPPPESADPPAAGAVVAQPDAAAAAPPAAPPAAPADTVTLSTASGPTDAIEAAVIVPPAVQPGLAGTPAETPQDEIFVAATDPSVPTANAVTLALPFAETDAPPAAQPLPPPFGTVFQLDAQGRIVPTVDGIVTPEGVRLVAGRPPVVPPQRPAAAAPAGEAIAEDSATDGTTTTAAADSSNASAASVAGLVAEPGEAATIAADPALAGARPRPRPPALLPATGTEAPPTAADDAALPTTGDTGGDRRATSLRPRERPASVLAAGEAAGAAPEDALVASSADAAAAISLASLAAEAVDPNTSRLAVAVSRKPAARPRDFGPSVDAAVAEAVSAPDAAAAPGPKTAVAPAEAAPATIAMAMPDPKVPPKAAPEPKAARAPEAAPAPEPEPEPRAARNNRSDDPAVVEADEPEVEKAAPSIGTRANVAKQATFRNAINLSKTNLIGVYGSASNRYALVRQPNGRYVKVSVGDRVDGGRVATISDRELSYEKNGRTVTLKMPKS